MRRPSTRCDVLHRLQAASRAIVRAVPWLELASHLLLLPSSGVRREVEGSGRRSERLRFGYASADAC
eukprot:3364152-Rhodomonas_salina.1